MWFFYALLSALFAALTSILAKVGFDGVDSNLGTAIRTIVVAVMAWGIVYLTGQQYQVNTISQKNWYYLLLSGVATGASWLFYFKALQVGEVSKVVSVDKFSVVLTVVLAYVFLHEALNVKVVLGMILITLGTLIMAF